MKPEEKQYKKGDLLVLSTGEYSDYGIGIICKVLKDFTEEETAKSYKLHKKTKDQWGGKYELEEEEFIAILIRQGYVEELDYKEWNFSNYGEIEFS